jgi:hypothetical protein
VESLHASANYIASQLQKERQPWVVDYTLFICKHHIILYYIFKQY